MEEQEKLMQRQADSPRRAILYFVPVLAFAGLAVFLFFGLGMDLRKIPSPLVGKPLPSLALPLLDEPEQEWTDKQQRGRVWLLNVWASWCVACRAEHPMLNRLAAEGAEIVGLNYKDKSAEARQWLEEWGNPYRALPVDKGKAGLQLGVYGVPETFVIDAAGILRYKHIGPLTEEDLAEKIRPLLVRLREEAKTAS